MHFWAFVFVKPKNYLTCRFWACLGSYCSLHERKAPALQYIIDELVIQLLAKSFFLTTIIAVFDGLKVNGSMCFWQLPLDCWYLRGQIRHLFQTTHTYSRSMYADSLTKLLGRALVSPTLIVTTAHVAGNVCIYLAPCNVCPAQCSREHAYSCQSSITRKRTCTGKLLAQELKLACSIYSSWCTRSNYCL